MDAPTLLATVPAEVRPHLIPVGADKAPTRANWQAPTLRFSDHQLLAAAAIGLRLGHCGILAVDFDPPDDNPEAGAARFLEVTGRPATDLPPSWRWSSGRPGRWQTGLMVPSSQRTGLKPTSHGALEFRWLGQQSVIHGAHPITGAYHWLPGCNPAEIAIAEAPSWLIEAITPPPPKPYQPRLADSSGDRSPADWCRYYLGYWPNHDLEYWVGWWPTICAMHRAGLPIEEARAWSASSQKHTDAEFYSQWEKVGRRDHGYGIEWLGAATKANRPVKQDEFSNWPDLATIEAQTDG